MKPLSILCRSVAILSIFSVVWLTDSADAFTIADYQSDPSVAHIYDIFGTGLSSVTSLTGATYNIYGDSVSNLTFTALSDNELQISVTQDLTSYVDLRFASATFSDIEVPYYVGNYPGLVIIASGQNISGVGGSRRILVQTSATFNTGGGGSNVVFVESGATFTGTSGGGGNLIYYATGANITQNNGGGGANNYVPVDSINRLSAVPEPSSYPLLLGGLGMLIFFRRPKNARPSRCGG